MDLRSVLNDNGGDRERAMSQPQLGPGGPSPVAAPPHPQHQQQPQHAKHAPPPQAQNPHSQQRSPSMYNAYSPQQQKQAPPPMLPQHYSHPQPSPGKPPPSAEYQHHAGSIPHHHPHQQPPQGAYPPQSPYQTPGPYQNRPGPPPLQASNSFHDPRSPGGAPMHAQHAPPPSPYRPTPTPTSAKAQSQGGYPFPPTQASPQEMTSPSQRQHYPPLPVQRQDSYNQPAPSHVQGQYATHGHVPQTPPIATSGVPPQQYPHKPSQSQSAQSTPTPTSAHSQHQYGQPFVHGSPVSATHAPPVEFNRQPSQPPTPLGPPIAQRRQSQSYAQPPSPYQQRMSSVGAHYPQQVHQPSPAQPPSQPQASPQQRQQTQPPLQLPGQVGQRPPSGHHQPEPPSQHPQPPSQHSSHLEREHSMSVSPKTRVPSLPSNADRSSFSREAPEVQAPPPPPQVQIPQKSSALPQPPAAQNMAIDGTTTPMKRKIEDRDLSPRELERKETRPPPGAVNGRTPSDKGEAITQDGDIKMTESPPAARKKPTYYTEIPIWAQSCHMLGKKLPNKANFVLQHRAHSHLNGSVASKRKGSIHPSPKVARAQPPQPPPEPTPEDILGPWEPSITGVKPLEELAKVMADFLYMHVINHPDRGEITSRGIQFEIEAKLGVLIDKDTNSRVQRGVDTECILSDGGRTAFKSGLSETYHQAFNKWLNTLVQQCNPRQKSGGRRVPIQYKHRLEVDRFVDLPTDFQHRLPSCMQPQQGVRRKMKARLTYDQKTNQVLAKIVKTRVADIDWHMPRCPVDCRLSINLEMDWDGDVRELEALLNNQPDRQPDRIKDRLSYTHGHYQIDLTQVHSSGANARSEKEHELEIELSSPEVLSQGQRLLAHEPHKYSELVEGFLDNVRVLAHKVGDFRLDSHQ